MTDLVVVRKILHIVPSECFPYLAMYRELFAKLRKKRETFRNYVSLLCKSPEKSPLGQKSKKNRHALFSPTSPVFGGEDFEYTGPKM